MLEFYLFAKGVHVTCVILTITGFLLRGFWMITESPLLQHRMTRRIPPIIDTVLLTSALLTAYITHQYPGLLPWLTAKVIALLFYIGLGMVALTYGRNRHLRIWAFIGALLSFGYIVLVARTRHPWPFPYLMGL